MSIQTFDETQHPRETTGKFATKTTVEAEGGLGALDGEPAPLAAASSETNHGGVDQQEDFRHSLAGHPDVAPSTYPGIPWWVDGGAEKGVVAAAIDVAADGRGDSEAVAAQLRDDGTFTSDSSSVGLHFDPDQVLATTRTVVRERQARVAAAAARCGGLPDGTRLHEGDGGLRIVVDGTHEYTLSEFHEERSLKLMSADGSAVPDWEQNAALGELSTRMTGGRTSVPGPAKSLLRQVQRELTLS